MQIMGTPKIYPLTERIYLLQQPAEPQHFIRKPCRKCRWGMKALEVRKHMLTYLQLSNLDELVSHLPRHLPSRIHTPGRRTGPNCSSLPVTFGPVSHQAPVRVVPLDDTCSRPGTSTSRQQNKRICNLNTRCWGGQGCQLNNSKIGESAFFFSMLGCVRHLQYWENHHLDQIAAGLDWHFS